MKNRTLSFMVKGTVAALVIMIGISSFTTRKASDEKIDYPYGYRKWTHIKTAIVGPNSPAFKTTGGFHHIYANEKAMEGYATGNFPDGSIIVFDVIEAVTQTTSDVSEGKRKHIDVMVRNASLYEATGGWAYEEFVEGNKTEGVLTQEVKIQCFTCHKSQTDFVFSDFKDANQR
jgi:hypothetical protein